MERKPPALKTAFLGQQQAKTRFNYLILVAYLLIVLLSVPLHPFIITSLSGGLSWIEQPNFAVYIQNFKRNLTVANATQIDAFNRLADHHHRFMYALLLVIPLNVFVTLCLAFRFARDGLHITVAVAHFLLAAINCVLIVFVGVTSIVQKSTDKQNGQFDATPLYLIVVYVVVGVCCLVHLALGATNILRRQIEVRSKRKMEQKQLASTTNQKKSTTNAE
ncbi:hypothetical protein M3Y95_00617000 [Aphelenchoides besseyi]|nr:hypothetical protein M3Y95_00617000 [Aphelenchoides besseyi]